MSECANVQIVREDDNTSHSILYRDRLDPKIRNMKHFCLDLGYLGYGEGEGKGKGDESRFKSQNLDFQKNLVPSFSLFTWVEGIIHERACQKH